MLTFQTDFAVCGCSSFDSLRLMALWVVALVLTESAVNCCFNVDSLRVMTLCALALVLTVSD
jgi:hypothetical protein